MLEFFEIFFLGQHFILIDFCETYLSFEFLAGFKSVSTYFLSLLILSFDDSIAGDIQLVHVLLQTIHTCIIAPLLLFCVEPLSPLECTFRHLSVDDLRPV